MTRRRWIADEVSGDRAALLGEHADHLARVLRARVGQEFDIVAADRVRLGRIIAIKNDRVEFDLGEIIPQSVLAQITLFLAIYKFDRMEWAIEKCTELGVERIVPLIAHRTDPHLAASSTNRVQRWQRIARQAAEQSRRAAPPEIAIPVKLPAAVLSPAELRVVLAESEEQNLLRDVVISNDRAKTMSMAIGPEGGWSDQELELFRQAGWTSASLGKTILRAETAAIAATAVAVNAML